jgi:ABC-type multidrug transport system fused ATPase/permease subunit
VHFCSNILIALTIDYYGCPQPTSGLDARSALLVVRALRNISDKGQTIVATIHQPSSAIFEMFDELLLLKRGGQVVFQGDLGKDCSRLVNYFENLGATKIELGENPANWMLRVITSEDMGDLAQKYVESKEYALLRKDLDEIKAVQDPELKIEYKDEFAASKAVRQLLVNGRLRLIYWRSPAYNLSRLMVSMVIAFVLGSVFILVRHPEIYTEVEMRSRLSVIFLTFIITGIMAILSVIPVMTKIREMFYRHQDSGMYDSAAIGWALGSAEKLFIVLATTIFTVVFLSVAGMTKSLRGLFGFWVRLPKVTCYQGLENELVTPHIVSCFLLVGILHVQLCDILLLWTGFRLFG